MRLLDRLLAGEFESGIADRGKLLGLLGNAQLVVADNVGRYLETFKKGEYVDVSDFPIVIPPFEYTFVETKFSNKWREGVGQEGGVLLTLGEPRLPSGEISEEVRSWFMRPEVKHFLNAILFTTFRGTRPLVLSNALFPIDESGGVVPFDGSGKIKHAFRWLNPLRDVAGNELRGAELLRSHSSILGDTIYPALMAISFMHCRNVTVKKETPPLPLSKKHERRTGRPLLRYHVIQIDHMKQVLEREGHASTEGLRKALHICRGHFKHYGRDGKGLLFGKHAATVWVPMHTRGNLEEGAVVKDYDVK